MYETVERNYTALLACLGGQLVTKESIAEHNDLAIDFLKHFCMLMMMCPNQYTSEDRSCILEQLSAEEPNPSLFSTTLKKAQEVFGK